MNLSKIEPFQNQLLQVIIETPKLSSYKYDYDIRLDIFCLDKLLPLGMNFPYDFGFIPGTKGQDGDPLDVLVIMEYPALQGALVHCRIVGILEANQTERNGKTVRNDRIIAVWALSSQYKDFLDVEDLSLQTLHEVKNFFIQYNLLAGKKFESLGWKNSEEATKIIRSQIV
ncbi:MAG TPA: inorganic diphosphatase [Puia sp.]|jgi:inorganic pyrophosphatase|nr:inorganic diphosphatase [Puia sp.]